MCFRAAQPLGETIFRLKAWRLYSSRFAAETFDGHDAMPGREAEVSWDKKDHTVLSFCLYCL